MEKVIGILLWVVFVIFLYLIYKKIQKWDKILEEISTKQNAIRKDIMFLKDVLGAKDKDHN